MSNDDNKVASVTVTTTTTVYPLFISFRQVREIYGLPRTTIYRYIDQHGFPSPIAVGPNNVKFKKSDIDDWIENRPAAPTWPVSSAKGVTA